MEIISERLRVVVMEKNISQHMSIMQCHRFLFAGLIKSCQSKHPANKSNVRSYSIKHRELDKLAEA